MKRVTLCLLGPTQNFCSIYYWRSCLEQRHDIHVPIVLEAVWLKEPTALAKCPSWWTRCGFPSPADATFEEAQTSFCTRHCHVFDEGKENKLEYTQLFQDYVSRRWHQILAHF